MPATNPTSNEYLRDALVRHQVNLQRAGQTTAREVVSVLDRSVDDVRRLIRERLDGLVGERLDISEGTGALRRLQFLEDRIAQVRRASMDDATATLLDRMEELVRNEADFVLTSIEAAVPVVLDLASPSDRVLRALVRESPFRGRTMSDWASRMEDSELDRVNTSIRIGMVEGDDIPTITGRVMDGIQVTRNQAEAISRTAVNHYSNEARQLAYDENPGLVEVEVYTATLDDRTSDECAGLDGTEFPVGEGEMPPLHWNCRSVRVPVVGELQGDRPFKSSTEEDLVGEYARENDLGDVTSRDDLPRGTRGAYDDFARSRVRELTGAVPATTTYSDFLGRQSAAFQEEVLGKTKAKLFRDGGLELRRFVNRQGDSLTLGELARRDRDAFVRAGLDPKRFR